LPNGSVEAVFEGPEENIAKMIEWCRRGPRFAKVGSVVVKDEPYTGEFGRFSIRY